MHRGLKLSGTVRDIDTDTYTPQQEDKEMELIIVTITDSYTTASILKSLTSGMRRWTMNQINTQLTTNRVVTK